MKVAENRCWMIERELGSVRFRDVSVGRGDAGSLSARRRRCVRDDSRMRWDWMTYTNVGESIGALCGK